MNKYTHSNLKGSGSNEQQFYKGLTYQKGYGIGDQFRRFFNWITPLLKKHALPKIESYLKKQEKKLLIQLQMQQKMLFKGGVLVRVLMKM